MSRVLIILLVLSAAAHADDADSYSAVSADELAKARADKLSCAALETAPDYQMSKTERQAVVARCRADKWRLEAVICFARESAFGCERWLTKAQAQKRERMLVKLSTVIGGERRASAVEMARKNGLLGDQRLVGGAGTGGDNGVQLNDTRPAFDKRSQGHARPDVWSRLRDVDGPVAGLPGYAITHQEDPKRCGGIAIVVSKTAKVTVSEADAPLAALYDLDVPTGLDISRHKKAATQRKVAGTPQLMKTSGQRSPRYLATRVDLVIPIFAAAPSRAAAAGALRRRVAYAELDEIAVPVTRGQRVARLVPAQRGLAAGMHGR